MATVKIKRTSSGLKDALFEAIEALRAGDINPDEAKHVAGLAKEIVAVTRLELDVFNYARSNGLEGSDASPPDIEMVRADDDETKSLPPMRSRPHGDDDADRPSV